MPTAYTGSSMGFWRTQRFGGAVAALDGRSGTEWTYAQLGEDAARIQASLPRPGRKTLGVLLANNRYQCLAAYVAALNADTALIVLDASLNVELLGEFLSAYRPDWLFSDDPEFGIAGYRQSPSGMPRLRLNDRAEDIGIHPDLALLLTTSGSTGSPKLVRLTLSNLASNADSIARFLNLTPAERPITSLPLSYSYGLSVIASHLQAGAAIVFTEDGVLRREFWDTIDRYACTSFAGVPYTYQMLVQTGLLNQKGASLRTLTQAGGKLDDRRTEDLYRLSLKRNWRFFVMYGQTEATARISYVPFDHLGRKIGSVGIPVPGGALEVDEHTSELIYSGPNVMMGYAACREDLARGDELNGVLRTGDLARLDAEGYCYITGRLRRFLKMFGKRFNLDELESILASRIGSPVACFGRDDLLIAAVQDPEDPERVARTVCGMFGLPRSAAKAFAVKILPRTPNGKLDYQRLAEAERTAHVAIAR